MTHPLAALIAGVPRCDPDWNREMMRVAADGDYVEYDRILAALEAVQPPANEKGGDAIDGNGSKPSATSPGVTAGAMLPDLVGAGKVLEGIETPAAPYAHYTKAVKYNLSVQVNLGKLTDAADTIRALIALATAQAAQIAGLETERRRATNEAETLRHYRKSHIDAEERLAAAEAKVAELTKERDEWRDCAARNISKLGLALQNERDAKDSAEAKVAELEAQIAEARADYQRESDQHDETAAEAATLRAEVERLRGVLDQIADDLARTVNEELTPFERGNITVTAHLLARRAALEGKT